jgi:hypothetical protein
VLKGSPKLYPDPFNQHSKTPAATGRPSREKLDPDSADTWLISTFQTGVEYNPRVDELSHCANQKQPAVIDGVRAIRLVITTVPKNSAAMAS